MTIQEILDDVDNNWMPNTLSTATKVQWLNGIQNEIYRKVTFPNQVYRFQTTANVATYPLPSDCPADRIQHVVAVDASGTQLEYEFARMLDDNPPDQFYTILTDSLIMLYPTPTTTGLDVFIYYAKKPRPIVATSTASTEDIELSGEPDIPKDYHEIFVWGLAARVAKTQRDVDMVNNFNADYLEILNTMIRDFSPKPELRPRYIEEVDW